MAVQAGAIGQSTTAGQTWYSRSPDEVGAALGVDPASGLPGSRAAELLAADGPNALPEEKPKPGWLRFLEEYRSYMQIILVAAAIVSLAIKEWSTAVLLLLLTVLNAVVGPAAGGQGRERDERAQVDDEGDRPGAAGRVRVRDPGRAGGRGRHRPASPPGTRCPPTVASSRPAPCRSTSRR